MEIVKGPGSGDGSNGDGTRAYGRALPPGVTVNVPAHPVIVPSEPHAESAPAEDPPEWALLDGPAADRQRAYLRALSALGTLRAGVRAARVGHRAPYEWRENDGSTQMDGKLFSLLEKQAHSDFTDALEEVAWQRAVQGVTRSKPLMFRGQVAAHEVVTEFSDALMIKLLESRRPEKFRTKYELVTTAPTFESLTSPEQREIIRRALTGETEQDRAWVDQVLATGSPTAAGQTRAIPAPHDGTTQR